MIKTYQTFVLPQWIDYNGHMRDAYYLLIFSYATDGLMNRIGLDQTGREQNRSTLYTIEAHINYLSEIRVDTLVYVRTEITDFDHKRIHLVHSMFPDGAEAPAAKSEQMLISVGIDDARPINLSAGAQSILGDLLGERAAQWSPICRGIGIRRHDKPVFFDKREAL
jgi:acyl-CoA thioester hydrolase